MVKKNKRRYGVTNDHERRRKEHLRDYPNMTRWTLHPHRFYKTTTAQAWEDGHPDSFDKHHGGLVEGTGPYHGYEFYYN